LSAEPVLDRSLAERFHIVTQSITVGNRPFEFFKPRSADELISEEDFNRDERIPYWADIWPSARVLADRLTNLDGHSRRYLELGCGSGLPSVVAASRGFEVLATDYYDDALEFTRLNARHNGLPEPRTRMVDWRQFPDDLGRFDVVAAADVLYEKQYTTLVACAVARTLAPGGLGLVTDPGRWLAGEFPAECQQQGLAIFSHERVLFSEGNTKVTIDLYEIRWP